MTSNARVLLVLPGSVVSCGVLWFRCMARLTTTSVS